MRTSLLQIGSTVRLAVASIAITSLTVACGGGSRLPVPDQGPTTAAVPTPAAGSANGAAPAVPAAAPAVASTTTAQDTAARNARFRRMGEESVILCRDRANTIHVFLNSCRHRGMKVCRYDEGNTPVFSCPYHGWSYSTDGNLVSVPGELIGVPQFATGMTGAPVRRTRSRRLR